MSYAHGNWTTNTIAEELNKLPFVKWDRCASDEDELVAYGWITRDDGKFDFVVLTFTENGVGYVTSSKRYSEEIGWRLDGYEEPPVTPRSSHSPCRRIETSIPGVNHCIRLS